VELDNVAELGSAFLCRHGRYLRYRLGGDNAITIKNSAQTCVAPLLG
jgi:hypothetical protein